MQENEHATQDVKEYFSIRKKHFFIWLLIFAVLLTLGLRYLFLHGFYMGFTPPQEPAPPLSQELISRFIQLEDRLNKTINDVNEVYTFKEKLEKKQPSKDLNKNNINKGGKYLPLEKLNLAEDEYLLELSFAKLSQMLTHINDKLPFLKRNLKEEVYLFTNLPEGVPLLGQYMVSSGFGERLDPFTSQPAFHQGIDFIADIGTPVVAVDKGRVSKIDLTKGRTAYGNSIEITHPNDVTTVYGHLSEILVKENQLLEKGALIGRVGNSGRSTGPHLHYEVLIAGKAIDPMGKKSPIALQPNTTALSALNTEMRSKCLPLLLLVKDESSKIFTDCLAAKGQGLTGVLMAQQSEAAPLKKPDANKLVDGCTYVDASQRLQTVNSAECQGNSKSISLQ